jgi:hypothetical protein
LFGFHAGSEVPGERSSQGNFYRIESKPVGEVQEFVAEFLNRPHLIDAIFLAATRYTSPSRGRSPRAEGSRESTATHEENPSLSFGLAAGRGRGDSGDLQVEGAAVPT